MLRALSFIIHIQISSLASGLKGITRLVEICLLIVLCVGYPLVFIAFIVVPVGYVHIRAYLARNKSVSVIEILSGQNI